MFVDIAFCLQFLTNPNWVLFFKFYLRFPGNQGERFNNLKEKVNRKFSRCLTVLIIIECEYYIH